MGGGEAMVFSQDSEFKQLRGGSGCRRGKPGHSKGDLRERLSLRPGYHQALRGLLGIGVAFVKTSTGYGFVKQDDGMYSYRGATAHHLRLMRRHCSPAAQIKAAGGVRTLDDLLKVREAGASRVGATATRIILKEAKKRGIG